jgi:Na+-translocating ferredoxin:NAD+ oxidoreductase RnfD subunit
MSSPRAVAYPAWGDPRWWIVAFLLSFVTYAITSPGFHRSLSQWVLGVGICVFLDGLLLWRYQKVLVLPFSGFISSMGLLLLCDSPAVWPYPLAAALAMLSKHFIRVGGRHIFNPANFGVVVVILFFSSEVTVVAARWGGSTIGLAAVACLGVAVAIKAKRIMLSAVYVAAYLGGAAILATWGAGAFALALTIVSSAAFQLFTFFMITDPMTTPNDRRGQVVYAVALAVIEHIFRIVGYKSAPFFALFLLSGIRPLFGFDTAEVARRLNWRLSTFQLGKR